MTINDIVDEVVDEEEEDDDDNDDDSDDGAFDIVLQNLLSSLANGARAVQGLPSTEDDYNYERSFPEFGGQLLTSTHQAWYDAIQTILRHPGLVNNNNNNNSDDSIDGITVATGNKSKGKTTTTTTTRIKNEYNNDDDVVYNAINDPVLWDECAEVCEMLLEQINGMSSTTTASSTRIIENVTTVAQYNSTNQWKQMERMIKNDIPKPQILYRHIVPPVRDNDRRIPFVPPIIHPTNKPYSIIPIPYNNDQNQIQLLPGHGLESKYGPQQQLRTSSYNKVDTNNDPSTVKKRILPYDIVAPTEYCPHLYETEINSFQYTDKQLDIDKVLLDQKDMTIAAVSTLSAKWIDTVQGLQELVTTIKDNTIQEIAVDLEAHSFRSFSGFVCLMQLSIRIGHGTIQNYLIDTIVLDRHYITLYMAPIFANPSIVKILHGADHDIPWLQRDFGIYVVNLFDTGRAARQLQFASASYAFLLKRYVSTDLLIDKTYQLADWRQRPIPDTMQQYAIQDTFYLLDIYDRIKIELYQAGGTNYIQQVFDTSRLVCLIRYSPEPFKPSGYKSLIRNSKTTISKGRMNRNRRTNTDLNRRQEAVLRTLWDWRDQTARTYDESVQYVCPNHALMRLAMSCPSTTMQLQSLFNPIPSLVLKHSQDIVRLVNLASTELNHEQQQHTPQSSNTKLVATVITAATTNPGDIDENEDEDEEIGAFNRHSSSTKGEDGDDEDDDDDDEFEDDEDDDEEPDVEDEDDHHNSLPRNQPNPNSISQSVGPGGFTRHNGPTSSTFFKPAPTNTSKANNTVVKGNNQVASNEAHYRRGMMSPVLGTEALYKQAGWMTPQEQQQQQQQVLHHRLKPSGSTDTWGSELVYEDSESTAPDVDDNNNNHQKPNRLLSVHPSNKGYQSKQNIEHNLSVNAISAATSQIALASTSDRLGAGFNNNVNYAPTLISDDATSNKGKAIRDSNRIRSGLQDSVPTVLGIATARNNNNEQDDDDDDDDASDNGSGQRAAFIDDNENKLNHRGSDKKGVYNNDTASTNAPDQPFPIPKSIREIYKISNRNRRNKKASSPTPDRESIQMDEKERAELKKAEALLRERGLMGGNSSSFLFADEIAGTAAASNAANKRQRAKSGRESEESVPDVTSNVVDQDQDLAFMKQVGWIRNDEDVDELLNRRYGKSVNAGGATPEGMEGDILSSGVDDIEYGRLERSTSTSKSTPSRSGTTSPYDNPNTTMTTSGTPTRYTTTSPATMGLIPPPHQCLPVQNNPFFSGSALIGGPLSQQGNQRVASNSNSARSEHSSSAPSTKGTPRRPGSGGGRGKPNRVKQHERPDKRGERTFAYRSKK